MRNLTVAFTTAAIALAAFHLWTALFGVMESFTQRSVHLLLVCLALPMLALLGPRESRSRRFLLLAGSLMVVVPLLFNIWTGDYWANHMAYVVPLETVPIILACIGIVGLVILSERTLGPAFAVIVCAFILYAWLGQYIPGRFGHRGFSLSWAVDHFWYTKEGVFGIPLGVSATYIYLFVLFGALLDRCGGGKFMIDLAIAATGRFRGGPAKAAIVGSAVMGTISGSAVANVVTTGAVTIPLMKRNGYKPHFAGAVEAAASSGGQLVPPVMGATAFVIAEFVGRPYSEIALSAVFPALLFYVGIFMAVHFEALRTGLAGNLKVQSLVAMLREGALFLLPIGVIAWSVFQYSPMRAALYGIGSVIAVAAFYRILRGDLLKLPLLVVNGVVEAAKAIGPVAIACAASGLIVGVLSLTGLGITINSAILSVAGSSMIAALVLTMISSLILGMGLPTVAAYLVQVGVTIPALVNLGVDPVGAHLFVFYFAILGNVTPPVAVAAYAAAAVANSNPDKTGWQALAICLPAFIVPYMFVLEPALIMQGSGVSEAIWPLATAIVGVVGLAAAIVGNGFVPLNLILRIVVGIGACAMLYPGIASDIAGVLVMGGALLTGKALAQKQATAASEGS